MPAGLWESHDPRGAGVRLDRQADTLARCLMEGKLRQTFESLGREPPKKKVDRKAHAHICLMCCRFFHHLLQPLRSMENARAKQVAGPKRKEKRKRPVEQAMERGQKEEAEDAEE